MQDGGCVWYVFIIGEAVKQSNLLPPYRAKMRRKVKKEKRGVAVVVAGYQFSRKAT